MYSLKNPFFHVIELPCAVAADVFSRNLWQLSCTEVSAELMMYVHCELPPTSGFGTLTVPLQVPANFGRGSAVVVAGRATFFVEDAPSPVFGLTECFRFGVAGSSAAGVAFSSGSTIGAGSCGTSEKKSAAPASVMSKVRPLIFFLNTRQR